MSQRIEKVLYLLGIRLQPAISKEQWVIEWAASDSAYRQLFWGRTLALVMMIIPINMLGLLESPQLFYFVLGAIPVEIILAFVVMRKRAGVILADLRTHLGNSSPSSSAGFGEEQPRVR